MYKSMKRKDLIKELIRKGFILVRDAEHKVFKKDTITVSIPHSNVISPGLVNQVFKVLKNA